jgi:phosphotransferase system enzyme I (PtsI)
MRQTLELEGRPASGGIALGPVVVIREDVGIRPHSGDATTEREALSAALASAIEELETLSDSIHGEGADILAFQIAMLDDDNLREPALRAIVDGKSASESWRFAVDHEIDTYISSEDEYFRERAVDLRDLRDRVLRRLAGDTAIARRPAGAILAGEDVAPTQFLQTDWSKGGGLVLSGGSPTSHVAMLARSRGVPMVVGLGTTSFEGHAEAIVDGEGGTVVLSPGAGERAWFERRRREIENLRDQEAAFLPRPARTADGTRIEVLINVASVEDVDRIDVSTCDGIGLMRTEFLFRDGEPLPDEETQFRSYRRFLEWADGRPVTIRTLDIGGDKPVRPLTQTGERNPFLGLRGVRLTLKHRDVFRVQLRALARACVHGNLKVMIPMVTVPEELDQSAQLLEEVVAELAARGIPCARPALGMMVEVPAAAIAPELFGAAEFFSIGSNDLTQYVTASSRDDPSVAALNDAGHPAVTALIGRVAVHARTVGKPASLCGDMASDPRHVETLLRAGLRSLSVAPARLGRVKSTIAGINLER